MMILLLFLLGFPAVQSIDWSYDTSTVPFCRHHMTTNCVLNFTIYKRINGKHQMDLALRRISVTDWTKPMETGKINKFSFPVDKLGVHGALAIVVKAVSLDNFGGSKETEVFSSDITVP